MKGAIATDPMGIERKIKEYYKCLHKFDNMQEVEQFLEKHNIPKLTEIIKHACIY